MFYRKETAHQEAEESLRRRELGLRLLQIVLLVVFVGSLIKLSTGPFPWSKGVIQQITKVEPSLEKPKAITEFPNWIKSEIDHPKLLRAKEHGIIGVWYGAAFALVASFLLLITTRWWLPYSEHEGLEEVDVDEADAENKGDTGFAKLLSARPLFYLLVIAAMATGAFYRAPELTHSLWNDEEYAMRRFAHGAWEEKAFKPVTWNDTLFENHNGNNHLLHSLLSRVSLDIWSSLHSDAATGAFSEAAARMPAFIAGLLAIALVAFLGWELGVPWVGVGAAWFFALHPWLVRYGAEAKGYALAIFFVCLALYGLVRALRHQRPGDWALFVIGQAGFLLSFAGSLYVAIAINTVAFIECAVRRQPRHIAALIAFNLIAAIPVVVWMLPSAPQLFGFIAHDNSPRLPPDLAWLRDLGGHLAAGVTTTNLEPDTHQGISWSAFQTSHPLAVNILTWGLMGLTVLGLVIAVIDTMASRLIIVAPALAGGLSFWHAHVDQHPNLPMYYIYLMIPMALAWALAVSRLRVAPAVLILVTVAAFGFATEQPRQMYVSHDRQPIRQTVQAIREKKPDALTGTFGVSDRQAQSYDPDVRLLSKPEDVDALLAEGKSSGLPVFIYVAGLTESTKRSPELMKRVALSPDFVPIKELKGLEAMYSYTIFMQAGIR